MRFIFLLAVLALCGCATQTGPDAKAPLVLKVADYRDLPGWGREQGWGEFAMAFERSCARIVKRSPDGSFGPEAHWGTYADWQAPCRAYLQESPADLRAFLQSWYRPVAVYAGSSDEGLFTGYYEAALRGSRTKNGVYRTPLRLRPEDLVMVDLGEFRKELKGQRIAGRVKGAHLKPYETREQIESGKLPDEHDKALVWVDDPVDAFFVQVQGSGVVMLDDGMPLRIGYDGQNGHPYYAIGRALVAKGVMDKDQISLQTIRAWLEAHPDDAQTLMNANPSYVFFKELYGEGPVGGEGVALTPGRSLAIDRAILPYGMPLWIDVDPPGGSGADIRRLVMAQDTGGAIIGAVRGDLFWGYGSEAERNAGIMKSRGQYWALRPKSIQ